MNQMMIVYDEPRTSGIRGATEQRRQLFSNTLGHAVARPSLIR